MNATATSDPPKHKIVLVDGWEYLAMTREDSERLATGSIFVPEVGKVLAARRRPGESMLFVHWVAPEEFDSIAKKASL